MNRLASLAASTRPLAAAFIDLLGTPRGGFARCRPTIPESEEEEEDNQIRLGLESDEGDRGEVHAARVVYPDEAAVATLMGRAFEGSRDTLARLRNRDMVAIVEVAAPDLVAPVKRFLRQRLLGATAPVLDGADLSRKSGTAENGAVILFAAAVAGAPDKTDDATFAAAIQLRAAIIGIAEHASQLPRGLGCLAEHRVVVPPIDAEVVAEVIEAVTGVRPGAIENFKAQVTLEMLSTAIRADLGAERSLARLRRLVDVQRLGETGPRLSEMHGLGEAKTYGLELAAALKAYAAGTLPWSECPKGLLLSGPPGTGKTSVARALAAEVPLLNFASTSVSQWLSHRDGTLGHVTAAIKKCFSEARRPGILFIDEIDSLPARGSSTQHDPWYSSVVNCVLEAIDGYEKRPGLVVIAACNAPSKLDPALVRAGRLDHHIVIPLPDVPGLTESSVCISAPTWRMSTFVPRHSRPADPPAPTSKSGSVWRGTARSTGRELDLNDLLDAVRGGQLEWPTDLRRRIAYHEAGHAIVHLALGTAEPRSLSIGGDGGLAESTPGAMRAETRARFESFLVALLGGRAAEQLIMNDVTAGSAGSAGSDLGRATRLAMRLETSSGLGSLGLVALCGNLNERDLLQFEPLRTAVGKTLDRAYATALDVLTCNRQPLEALAEALFTAGYLEQTEIEAVLRSMPLRRPSYDGPPALHPQVHQGDFAAATNGGDIPSVQAVVTDPWSSQAAST